MPEDRRKEQASWGSTGQRLFSRLFVRVCALIWRMSVDWGTRRPMLVRLSAHVSLLLLVLAVPILAAVSPAAQALGHSEINSPAVPLPPTPTIESLPAWQAIPPSVLTRLALPQTIIPERPRAEVITYTVQSGDNVYTIAQSFGLNVYSLIWSNRETLQDAPWLIQPGLTLYIPPVNGVYHLVTAGESIESIAAAYEVDPSALINEWNDIAEGSELHEGQFVMVVGGKSEYIDLVPPPPPPRYATASAAGWSSGVCSGVSFTGPGANGYFAYPTGSSRVSGWYFHDTRNPSHIGLDYACRSGNPIYASDNGVVTIAGWNGGYGILVELNHGNGFTTRYAHLSDLVVGCGQSVYQGQLIGYCGTTGWSTGPHLHFEVRYGGVPQDPQYYLP